MRFANRITAALNRPASDRSGGIDHNLVELAATLAASYDLTTEEFQGLLKGTITEGGLARIVSTRLHRLVETTLYKTSGGKTGSSTHNTDVTAAYEPADDGDRPDLSDEEARQQEAEEEDRQNYKKKLAQQIINQREGQKSGSAMRRGIAAHKDSLMQHLYSVPDEKRDMVVKATIQSLLDAGTAMTKRQHGDRMPGKGWSVGNNYKPSLPKRPLRTAHGDTNMESVTSSEDRDAVIYEHKLILLNEFLGGLAKKLGGLKGAFGGDSKPTDGGQPKYVELKQPNKELGIKIRADINGLIQAIEKQQLDLNSQGQLLKTIIQDIINKMKVSVGPKDDEGIKGLIQKYIANAIKQQAGEKEISLTVQYGGMNKKRSSLVLSAYADAVKTIGKPYRTMVNKDIGQVEFVIDNSDPDATETETNQLSRKDAYQIKKFAANQAAKAQPGPKGAPQDDRRLVGLIIATVSNEYNHDKKARTMDIPGGPEYCPVFTELGAHWMIKDGKWWLLPQDRVPGIKSNKHPKIKYLGL